MRSYCAVTVVMLLTVCSCHDEGVLPVGEQEQSVIQVKSNSPWYALNQSSDGYWTCMIYSTLTNISLQDTFFSRLGDYMNCSTDQTDLFIAEGSDGFVEKSEPGSAWIAQERGIMIEGVRTVVLRPLHSYKLISYVRWQVHETGSYRLTIQSFRSIDSVGLAIPVVSHSNTFSLK